MKLGLFSHESIVRPGLADLQYFFKNGPSPASFCIFLLILVHFNVNFYRKIADYSGIRTRIVGVEGECADHLTSTTTAPFTRLLFKKFTLKFLWLWSWHYSSVPTSKHQNFVWFCSKKWRRKFLIDDRARIVHFNAHNKTFSRFKSNQLFRGMPRYRCQDDFQLTATHITHT